MNFEDEIAVEDSMLRNRLRRMLGRTNLDAFQVDLIRILTGPDMAEYALRLIYVKNPDEFDDWVKNIHG